MALRSAAARTARASNGRSFSALPTRTLGSTGLEVTFPALGGVGLGSEFYGEVDETTGVDTVLTAVSRGINFIDTAPLYQHSEHRVGLALSSLEPEVKDSLIIASKVADECAPFSNNGAWRFSLPSCLPALLRPTQWPPPIGSSPCRFTRSLARSYRCCFAAAPRWARCPECRGSAVLDRQLSACPRH